ncbi:MAG: hypothetical protein ACSLFK_04855 [Gemmatimonadaceae bacterium]
MWIIGGLGVLLVIALVVPMLRDRAVRGYVIDRDTPSVADDPDDQPHDATRGTSVLQRKAVLKSLVNGAPPAPWVLRKEDESAMEALETFFARAIPNPTADGRPFITGTMGYGGPQLELYVPILGTRDPVAVVARSWNPASEVLESNLFFAGAVTGRLAEVVSRAGFERTSAQNDGGFTVFRDRQEMARQRTA